MNYRELGRVLRTKLGAEESREKYHVYFYLTKADRAYPVAKIPHSARGHDQVLGYVALDTARRLKLSRQELLQVVDCEIESEAFYRLWQQRDP